MYSNDSLLEYELTMTVSILTDTSDAFTTTSQRYSQEMRSTTDSSSAELVVQSEASIVQHHSLQYSIQCGPNFIIWFVKSLQWIDYFNQDSLMWSSAFHNLHAKKPSRYYMSFGLCGKPYHQETHQHSRIGYIGMIFSEVIIAVVSSAKFNESDHSNLCQHHQWILWTIRQKGSFRSAPNNKESIYFKRHAQENETVSDLSTYELVVQIVVSAVSDHVPKHQNPHKNFSSTQKSIFWLARSLEWSCQPNQRSDLLQNHRNQVKYCYEDTPSAFTGRKQISNATELDIRKLQRPGQRPGFTKNVDMIFFPLISPPTCPNIYLYGNGISISTPSGHHGQGHHNNLAPADVVKTGPLIKSTETINSTDQGTHEDQEDIALSQPERPDYVREDLKDQTSGSFNFHTIVLAENRLARIIIQSQHMMLSSGLSNLEQPVHKDPPAMQEKMLTKLQTSTPTSQPGTQKPPGLFNMSTPVRTDPQQYSPSDVHTVLNYQLKLKFKRIWQMTTDGLHFYKM